MDSGNAFGDLTQDYIAECLPLAEAVTDAFLQLERRWREGDAEADSVVELKRTLHTLKGNSAMMGLRPMQIVAHALEDVCARVVADVAARKPEIAALLIEGAGLLVDQIRGAAESPADPVRAEGFIARVAAALAVPTPGSRDVPPAPEPADRAGLRLERRRSERPADAAGGMIRVDFRRLDALLEIFGEAMIEQSALPEVYRRLAARCGSCPEIGELDRVVVALRATMKRLESALMDTRLLPIATVFARFNRLVRDLAQAERKQIRLVTEGGETLLDKAILDRIGEPLLHLLTNAVIHGVESAEERLRQGKPPEATLMLSAAALSDRVMVTVVDDGRGLDTERILAQARALDLDVGGGADAAHGLIFQPGLSTAESVSHVAGRGIGLAAAAAAIHALGGSIEVRSRPSRGVVFTLTLPLTLAILRSLIVEVDQERYAVPLSHVAETVRVEPNTVHAIDGRGVAMWRGSAINVADGGALLGTGATHSAPRNYFVVLFSGPRRRGLLVDRLVGHQDVVVKSLDPSLGRPDVVSGATILGDGRVACILDATGIVAQREVAQV
jgi:two-component system chemotaxis sensor kinase CheA